MPDMEYSHRDLICAYREMRRLKNAHPDLRDYYAKLYRKLSSFFDVDFENPMRAEDPEFEWLRGLFLSVTQCYESVVSPFQGYLEPPKVITEFYQLYGERISKSCEEMKGLYFELMCECYRRIYGDTGKSTSSKELRRRGFDDRKKPDEIDYL